MDDRIKITSEFLVKPDKILPRRGSKSEWEIVNPILSNGELALEYRDEGISSGDIRIKVGDGIHAWNDLPYGITGEEASSIHGGTVLDYKMLCIRSGSNEQWITVDPILDYGEIVYDETLGEIKVGDGFHKFTELRYIGEVWNKTVSFDFGDENED